MRRLTIPRSDQQTPESAEAVALAALSWSLADQARAERLLSLTGLTPDHLRNGLQDRTVLGAVLDFLANHEPDLIAASEALDMPPEAIVAAQRSLAA